MTLSKKKFKTLVQSSIAKFKQSEENCEIFISIANIRSF
jgi:hypothetical protein